MSTSHFVLPDCQVKPGQDFSFLTWAGKYCAKHKPDVIVCIGDFADMQSLSEYDKGKKSFEGRTYKADIEAAINAMTHFMTPILNEKDRLRDGHRKRWNPRLVLTSGNHCHRINRAIETDRKLEGLISPTDLKYESFGWEVYPFLEVVEIDGVCYSHYFCSGVMGRSVASARQLVIKKHQSCVMGHVQASEIDMSQRRADGVPLIGLFAGIYTPYDEGYLNPQTNKQHRQVWHNREVKDGFFYPSPISLEYLQRKYG